MPTLHHDTYPTIDTAGADLSGKVVVVTGASRGIGRATALSYAKAGISGIVVLARSDLSSLESEIAEAAKEGGRPQGPKVLRLAFDITSRGDIENAAAEVAKTFGKVDILINNAGFLENWNTVDQSDPDDWWRTWEVNVKGVYLMTKFFLPLVLESELKTVVMMSSVGAHFAAPGGSSYQSTKQTVLRLNSFLMVEYAEKGLLAFGIHPGVSSLQSLLLILPDRLLQGVLTELARKMPKWLTDMLTDTPELAGDALVWLTKERREW